MTRKELIAALAAAGSDEPEAEAREILEDLFSVSPAMQMCDRTRDYRSDVLDPLLRRRAGGEPLAYILGHRRFFREDYDLSPDTLIPRRETELLVETAIGLLPPGGRYADLCTGSGCVAISLAAARKDASGIGIDISAGAIRMAVHNAEKNRVGERVAFREGDVLAPDASFPLCKEMYHAILANPPYIPTSDLAQLPSDVRREPRRALDGGDDGMLFYRSILAHGRKNLTQGGFFLFEIGYNQEAAIREAAEDAGMRCRVLRDTSGNARVAHIY